MVQLVAVEQDEVVTGVPVTVVVLQLVTVLTAGVLQLVTGVDVDFPGVVEAVEADPQLVQLSPLPVEVVFAVPVVMVEVIVEVMVEVLQMGVGDG